MTKGGYMKNVENVLNDSLGIRVIMRKIKIIFCIFYLLSFYIIAFSKTLPLDSKLLNSFSTSFKEFFESKGTLLMSQEIEIIGSIRGFKNGEDGNIWILDSKKCNIKSYSSSGTLRFVLGGHGAGPGEFHKPFDFFISKSCIYVLDPIIHRIHVIDRKTLKFSHFLRIRDGRSIHVIEDQKIIVAAPSLLDPEKKIKQFNCLHIYNNKGVLDRSFYPLNDDAIKNQLICDGVFFCMDKNGNIFAVQEMAYKIFNYTIDGTFIRSFTTPVNPRYIPPPKKSFDKSFLESQVKKWLVSWTHITGIYTCMDFIVVNMVNYDDQEDRYIIDVYDTKGNFIKGGMESDYRLLNIDKDGTAYFLKDNFDDEENVTIIKFGLKKQNAIATK
jgi:hypothetical protein